MDNIGDKISEILKNPDAMSQISQMMSGAHSTGAPSGDDLEMTRKISQISSKRNDSSDPMINRFCALEP